MPAGLDAMLALYGIERWGAGYFDISPKGTLVVRPGKGDKRFADVKEIVDYLNENRNSSPNRKSASLLDLRASVDPSILKHDKKPG